MHLDNELGALEAIEIAIFSWFVVHWARLLAAVANEEIMLGHLIAIDIVGWIKTTAASVECHLLMSRGHFISSALCSHVSLDLQTVCCYLFANEKRRRIWPIIAAVRRTMRNRILEPPALILDSIYENWIGLLLSISWLNKPTAHFNEIVHTRWLANHSAELLMGCVLFLKLRTQRLCNNRHEIRNLAAISQDGMDVPLICDAIHQSKQSNWPIRRFLIASGNVL